MLGDTRAHPARLAAVSAAATAATVGWALTARRLHQCTRELSRAHRDGTTGLLTRHKWRAVACRQTAGDAVCGLLDIDQFKTINDRLGHPCGDEILRTVAQRLAAELGSGGIAGRIGGDELAFITHWGAPQPATAALHEALARPVAVSTCPGPIEVGVSLGTTALDAATAHLDAALARADAAMYQAKRHGTGWSWSTSAVPLAQLPPVPHPPA